ncbi:MULTISPECIES: PLP-dependent aminotransferase family protein [Streptomyces]|uniref:PLP-dependent aminotransferase family protein n=1 Tax=Streptomyces thermoviolaceus subsp. thermoviolaceus TaxID=66860 RepID=A0ABX0YU98_STRTL|nr:MULTISPECIES: PLP-dependent aminotransferase family protein [Streptomyces]MCM3262893.1 PLP-dependent aminotransferase family protein [Streptomyces thermoviolaceus]NJP15909.1 PLP-dependent aminotransferase family protein [Streptomyces thermoviolaceus subsp. thermoviolaceus]RSS07811.1 PLP-dependent aminotransferase family protein [Streptomyces sp. WAC00469]WTD47625.1 PLP-dependent aminotransferase family protein [Streptomyces thermoviolaceus]GGV79753.1 GntR family transcriptional regulator [S
MWTEIRPAVEMPRLFERGADVVSFAGGLPDLDVLPLETVSAQLSRLVRLGGRLALQYTTPHVAGALVPAIDDLMAREGSSAVADRLVPTGGSQMGLMAVGLALASPGHTVLVQTPAYPGATAAFRTAGLDLHAAPEDGEGVDPQALRATVTRLRADGRTVRLLYCNPTFQNPTGATLSEQRRRALLAAARELDLVVVEDNPYGLLGFDGHTTTALHALDPDRVVYLGTFSKVFAPGLRCGWIAAPEPLVPALRNTTEVMSLSPSALAQSAIAAFYTRSGWTELLEAYRASYRERCALLADALEAELGTDGPWQWERPAGGFYLWLRHREGVDTTRLAETAAAHGVSFVPGSHFGLDGEHADALRLCFSNVPRKRIAEGAARLAAALTAPAPEQRGAA